MSSQRSLEKDPALLGTNLAQGARRPDIRPHIPIRDTAEFYDTLSKVRLSRRALKEFDRRCVAQKRPARVQRDDIANFRYVGRALDRLKRFARHGGPSLSHLRGYQGSFLTMKPSSSVGFKDIVIAKSTPYNGDFEQKMADIGVYHHNRASKPQNLQEVREYLARPHRSMSASELAKAAFEKFTAQCEEAAHEPSGIAGLIQIIAGEGIAKHYRSMSDVVFNYSRQFATGIACAMPDFCDGARPDDIHRHVRDELDRIIIPSNNTHYLAAPNFFLEGKGISGRVDVAKRQACHDGAIGARAMHALQNYKLDDPVYDGRARSFACTLQKGSGLFQLYVTHLTPPKTVNGHPEYHMTLVVAHVMIGNLIGFRDAMVAFQNARDLARSYRNESIQAANERASYTLPATMSDAPNKTLQTSKRKRDVEITRQQSSTRS